MSQTYDLLICGCGPTGATLANLLAAKGHRVAIFDRDTEIFHAPRAMMLDAESCRIFQSMGIMQKLEKQDSKPFYQHRFVNKNRRRLIDFDFRDLPETFGHPAVGTYFHQPSLERFLREEFLAHQPRVDMFLGYEVTEVTNGPDVAQLSARNSATGGAETFFGHYLVGADGGNSLIRRRIADRREDLNYSRQWIVMDMIVHDRGVWDAIREGAEFKCDANAAVVFVKGHHGHIRLDCETTREKAATFSEADARRMAHSYFDASSAEFIRIAPYHFYAGMPTKWRDGRLLIAGDAAHQTSPFAGQGLNMGLRDAANLAFKFDLIFTGKAGERLLDSYEQERWQNCKSVILAATANGTMLSISSKWGMFKRDMAFLMARIWQSLGRDIVTRGITYPGYRAGLIGTSELAGKRLPQPLVKLGDKHVLLDELLSDGFCLLLKQSETGRDLDAFQTNLSGRVLTLGEDFTDTENILARFMDSHQALLCRPDKYIFDAGESGNRLCNDLMEALSQTGKGGAR